MSVSERMKGNRVGVRPLISVVDYVKPKLGERGLIGEYRACYGGEADPSVGQAADDGLAVVRTKDLLALSAFASACGEGNAKLLVAATKFLQAYERQAKLNEGSLLGKPPDPAVESRLLAETALAAQQFRQMLGG